MDESRQGSLFNKVLYNTLFLYLRQIVILGVNLFSVKLVLQALGTVDFGVYNAVAGVVLLFSFLSTSMATASQRYLSFAIGKNDKFLLKRTFSVTFLIYLLLALAVLFLAETVGLWFFLNQLVLPEERIEAASWVYQAAIASFIITVLITPYISAVVAHEKMKIYAYISIVESLLKLLAVCLLYVYSLDKLVMYGFLLLGVNIIIGICYLSYCLKYFEECRLRFIWDGQLFREAFSFTGWTLFGAFSTVLRNQALTVLFNQFFGAVAVAARTIALSISGTVTVFANSFSTGINPTIVKEYAAGRKESMLSLVLSGSKLTFFLTWIFALPMFIHMDFVLQIWLGTLIEDVVLFSRLALIETLIFSISICLAAAARAPGKMKAYESILGTLQIMIFVFSYFLFSIGFDAETAFYVAIAINILMFFVRLVMVRSLIGLSIRVFFRNALVPITLVAILSSIPTIWLYTYMPESFFNRFCNIIVSLLLSTATMYFLGLDKDMRQKINNRLLSRLKGGREI